MCAALEEPSHVFEAPSFHENRALIVCDDLRRNDARYGARLDGCHVAFRNQRLQSADGWRGVEGEEVRWSMEIRQAEAAGYR